MIKDNSAQEIKPKGAIGFFILLVLLAITIWLGMSFLLMSIA